MTYVQSIDYRTGYDVLCVPEVRVRQLSTEVQRKLQSLTAGAPRPAQITDLQEKIAGKTRAAELHALVSGAPDPERIWEIVGLKRELDRRIALWFEGRL